MSLNGTSAVHALNGSWQRLVVAVGVQGELTDEPAVVGDDANVQAGGEDEHPGAVVGGAQADVVQAAVVAPGEDASCTHLRDSPQERATSDFERPSTTTAATTTRARDIAPPPRGANYVSRHL